MSTAPYQTIVDPSAPAFRLDADGNPIFNLYLTQKLAAEKKAAEPYKLAMPEDCMYGYAGDLARAIEGPLGGCYLTILSMMAGMGVRTTDPELRTNLYCALLAPPGVGKGRIQSRAKRLLPQILDHVIDTDPASHQGIAQDFAPGKDEPPTSSPQYVVPDALYLLDELTNMLDACNTPGSGRRLAGTLCSLFYLESAGSSDKKGKHHIRARISICGCIPARDAAEFRKAMGSATLGGLYDRFLFAPLPSRYSWGEDWKPSIPAWDDETVQPEAFDDAPPIASRRTLSLRHPVRIPWSIKQQMIAWRETTPPHLILSDDEQAPSRSRLAELALRVAVISAAANGDREVTPDGMAAALRLMEWQERVRQVFSPAESDDRASECSTEIEQRFREAQEDRPPSYYIRWRDLDRRYHWSRKYASVLQPVKRMLVENGHLICKQTGEVDKFGNAKDDKALMRWSEE